MKRWSKTFRAIDSIDPQDNKQHSDFIDHEHKNCDQHKYLQNFHDAGQQRQVPHNARCSPIVIFDFWQAFAGVGKCPNLGMLDITL